MTFANTPLTELELSAATTQALLAKRVTTLMDVMALDLDDLHGKVRKEVKAFQNFVRTTFSFERMQEATVFLQRGMDLFPLGLLVCEGRLQLVNLSPANDNAAPTGATSHDEGGGEE